MKKNRRATARLVFALVACRALTDQLALASIDRWKAAASGIWQTGANWVDGTSPAGTNEATFDVPGSYIITFNDTPPAIQELNLSSGANVTFTRAGSVATSTLHVTSFIPFFGGSKDATIGAGSSLSLGTSFGGSFFVLKPLHLTVGDDLVVATGAALNVRFGSDVITTDLSSVGHVNVSGVGSTLYVSSMANIRAGSLNVTAGGLVESAIGSVSTIASFGDATLSGAGSQWNVSSDLIIGNGGHGALDILNGGSVFCTDGFIAQPVVNSSGVATVNGGNWTIARQLSIGYFLSPGRLDIGPGGTVSVARELFIDANGALFLVGGTLDASTVSFVGTAGGFVGDFDWRSGTLHVGIFDNFLRNQGGVLAPGHSAGSTTIIGGYEQQSGATLQFEIGGPLAVSHFDFVDVLGTAQLGGALELVLINGFLPAPDQTFVILIADQVTGAFDNAANGWRVLTSDGEGSFLVHYGPESLFDPGQVILSDYARAIPADDDLDGDVDLDDFAKFQSCTTGPALGPPLSTCQRWDFDADVDIDVLDFGGFHSCLSGPDFLGDPDCVP